eukprot:490800_1
MKPKTDTKKDAKFWRRTVSIKLNTENIKTCPVDTVNKSHNEKHTNIIKSQTIFKSINHSINLLNDPESDKSMKMNCLHFINEYLNKYQNYSKQNDTNTMEILKSLIKIFVSPKEPLRRFSIDIVSNHIGNNNIWNYFTSIKYVIPIIVHCILSKEYYEKSEEIRLKFLSLLENVINASSNEDEIKPICGDLIAICINLLHDKYIEINKKVCFLIIILSKKIRLNNVSQIIIKNALHLLSDRHSNVRITSIQLIECMLLNGAHESIQTLTGFREYNAVPLSWWFEGETRTNYFGGLCRHPTLSVRNAFYKMIFNIMTNMPERYDYKTLLLSYVLSGLQDKNKGIQEMAFNAIEKIGKMHENDEYNELKKILFFQQEAERTAKKYLSEDDDKFIYQFPFKYRPCLGSRVLIREHFNRIVHTALAELKNWKNDCKQMAMLLVRNMLIYAEEYCTQNTELMLSSFHDFINNNDIILSTTSKECCCLIGKYVYPNVWIDCVQDLMYHEFDIEWIIVLQQLMSYCPLKRVYEIRRQVVELMEYVFPFIQTSNHMEIRQIVKEILIKIDKAVKTNKNDDSKQNEVDDFMFSSEFCGFHLEIIDETQDKNEKLNDKNTQTLQQRIDNIINNISSN